MMKTIREFFRGVLRVLFAVLRVPCDAPRLSENATKMLPEVVKERIADTRCKRTKLHDGKHETVAHDGTPEVWS